MKLVGMYIQVALILGKVTRHACSVALLEQIQKRVENVLISGFICMVLILATLQFLNDLGETVRHYGVAQVIMEIDGAMDQCQ